ncbi:uncharacterized protein LOC132047627 [Lycium ferocissimum]|uniref:uncharacterized protein LOC132047627 n=1 Tax=Lycium ferocissimum TaxID=112874 RepID=UPI0028152225|nr:uncharacterized protein LOC132047627 [Lycium ferocissimum]
MAQVVTCRVKFIPLQLEFIATFVYVYNMKEDRKELWDHLSQLSGNHKEPWIVLGDFNVVLHREDRLGGNPVTLVEVTDFQNCIDNCGLEEIANSGSQYTWNDKQDARIFSKIDKVLVNGEWVDQMPDITAHILPEGISDHCPLVVQMLQSFSRKENQDREAMRRIQMQLQLTPLNATIQKEEKELSDKFRRSIYLAESILLRKQSNLD